MQYHTGDKVILTDEFGQEQVGTITITEAYGAKGQLGIKTDDYGMYVRFPEEVRPAKGGEGVTDATFLLSHTPTTEHRAIFRDGRVFLQQQTQLDFTAPEVGNLVWFLKAVKADKAVRHTYTDEFFTLEYDPANHELERFCITRPATSRSIAMTLATAYKLLDALTGNTERLVKEGQPQTK